MTETTSAVEVHPGHYWTAQPLGDEDDSTRGDDASTSTASIASSILHYRTVNGRTYHSDAVTETKYWGANDEAQIKALDIEHHTFTLMLDGKLHLAPLSADIKKVIDIGTGTGAWAIDFADLHSNVTVIGTDISPIQPAWVPPNVKFQIDDFTQPWTFAEESVDFIYARWLIGCVTNWTALFKEAYRTLKPGGWIETFESDGFFESDDGTLTDKNASSQWGHIFSEATKKHGSTASFTVVRDKVQQKSLREAGFVNIQENPIKCPFSEWPEDLKLKEIGLFTRAAWEADPEGFIGYMAHSLGWTKEEITVYCAHMRRELRGLKIHLYYRVNAVWAQKPFPPS